MISTTNQRYLRVAAVLAAALALMLMTGLQPVGAHEDSGYSHKSSIGYTNTDWMSKLDKNLRLSELSLPGTHDTMAYQVPTACGIAIDITKTQSMDLTTQLNSGIRALDIRARHIDDEFQMNHGECYLGTNFNLVLDVVAAFLIAHDQETIFMKIKEEHKEKNTTRTFEDTFLAYLNNPLYSSFFWTTTDQYANPTLDQIRGKIVILQNFSGTRYYGPNWPTFTGEDCPDFPTDDNGDHLCWKFRDNFDQYPKWENIKEYLETANKGNINTIYTAGLNGAVGSYPYFVASGHSSRETSAPRLLTGTVVSKNDYSKWPDFPRVSCGSLCSIAFEGMNTLTKDYLKAMGSGRVGIIMADFPGSGLIDAIIDLNPDGLAVADAGGPYEVNEGEEIIFDARGSYDPEGQPLLYLYDYIQGDPWQWELSYVSDTTARYTWYDDYSGKLTVAVTDDKSAGDARIVYDSADFVVKNVAPTIQTIEVDKATIQESETVTVSGTFSDPALGVATETFTGQAVWSDGATTAVTVGNGTFSTSRTFDDDPTGTLSDDFTVDVTISDDDGGDSLAVTSPTITVENVAPSVTNYGITDEISENGWVTVVGNISDPGLPDSFTLVIDWGDGSPVTYNYAAGTTYFQEEHRYLDDDPSGTKIDPYTVSLTLSDDDGGTWTTSSNVTVANIDPELTLTSGPFTIDENGVVTLTGTIVDPSGRDTYDLVVDWGDGPPVTYAYGPTTNGSRSFSEEHRYLDDKPSNSATDDYEIRVMVRDDDGGTDTASTMATVNNVAPVLSLTGAVINENGTATVNGTITDPGTKDPFKVVIDWGEGAPVTYTYPAGTTTLSEAHRYLDDNPTNTAQDTYSISATIEDDDLGQGTAATTLTVNNVAPLLSLTGTFIDENGTATVNGTITDPGIKDSFKVIVNWGEGRPQTYTYPPGTTSFSETHKYRDDDPSNTAQDIYAIHASIHDDDLGEGSAVTTVTVNNVNPVTTIDSLTDETGEAVGTGMRVVLVYTRVDLAASFTDVGTRDTHTAAIDWGDGSGDDLGATKGSVATSHIYTQPGEYSVLLEVTDDDTGVGPATASITVVDASGATGELIDQLETLLADPSLLPAAVGPLSDQLETLLADPSILPASVGPLSDALAQLNGQAGGAAESGALDLLAQGNTNAALVKMWQAMQSLEAAESADPALDLTAFKNLLALTAKSTAMSAILEAEAAATTPNGLRKVEEAYNLIDVADSLLASNNYVEAVEVYRKAAEQVQGLIH